MKKLILASTGIFLSCHSFAQEQHEIKLSAYLETYYGFDFNKPADHNRPGFIYSHNRRQEVNLNLGFLKGSYDNGMLRANLAVMTGTYANANMAAEPGVLKNLFEANAGIRLSKTVDLWLDAGILPSHIGYESAVSKDCWTLTRNISSDNTPFFETGLKLSYGSADKKWSVNVLYLNGWQRIRRQDGNSAPAGGLQVSFKPSSRVTLNYSNYAGTESPDSVRLVRLYHDFYGIFQLDEHFGLTAGFDYGLQQEESGSGLFDPVFSSVAVMKYQFNTNWAVAARAEYYRDEHHVFIADGKNGFETAGYSFNIDYLPFENASLRLEGKLYHSSEKVFSRQGRPVGHNAAITAGFAVSF